MGPGHLTPKKQIINRNIVYYLPRILEEHQCIYSCLQLHPGRTGFNVFEENTQQQLTFLALLPWLQSSSPP